LKTEHQGIIAWFAHNSVAANLLMGVILIAGLAQAFGIQQKTVPDFQTNNVEIRVPLPGAAPSDVEQGVVVKIEEAIEDVEGIHKIQSFSSRGSGRVLAEVAQERDIDDVMNDIKIRVDAISTFPVQAEKPIISKQEFRQPVIWLSLHGDAPVRTLQRTAEQVRDELVALPEITQAEVVGARDYEISIDVAENTLRKYGLTLQGIAQRVRAASLDLPAGTIRSAGGSILLRSTGQAYSGDDFSQIVVLTRKDGTRLKLGDIATIRDGFAQSDRYARFDGKRAFDIRVDSSGDENDIEIAKAVRRYAARKTPTLPTNTALDAWGDASFYLQDRLNMLLGNLKWGALLVFLTLTLFLRLKVALWVMVGIPVSFFGALWLMPMDPINVSVNMLSLFAFILVLGIVVDDAIIIGESVYTQIRQHGHTLDNVIRGARRVAMPATFGVLTTMAAFVPLIALNTQVAPFFKAIAAVVILCLFFSLVESKLILPTHLAHMRLRRIPDDERNALIRFQRFFADGLITVADRLYRPALHWTLENRYVTAASFTAVLIVTVAIVASGLVRWNTFPDVPNDFPRANLSMQPGTPAQQTRAAMAQLEHAVRQVDQRYRQDSGDPRGLAHHLLWFMRGDTSGSLVVEMTKPEQRSMDAYEFIRRWRAATGAMAGVKDLEFSAKTNVGGGGGPALSFLLSGDDPRALARAAAQLQQRLAHYRGVYDIRNSADSGTQEIRLRIKPSAQTLGLTMKDLAEQVREAFYGAEAERIQRGRDEVKVMVRYPPEERRSPGNLEQMRIRTADGTEVPFTEVAAVEAGTSATVIHRVNRKRAVTVSADVDPQQVTSGRVVRQISHAFVPRLLRRFPGIDFHLEGASQEQGELVAELIEAFAAALFLIYALIAIPLRSYTQPLIVMAAIPFGIVGAIFGHLLLGLTASMMSAFGIIALAGVVVNDSLIMVEFVNRERDAGRSLVDAVSHSGLQRFRAIVLTSLTTFAGVVPVFFEKSLQAQYVIPMAVALGFGILFATVITLFLIPALYLILDDAQRYLRTVGIHLRRNAHNGSGLR